METRNITGKPRRRRLDLILADIQMLQAAGDRRGPQGDEKLARLKQQAKELLDEPSGVHDPHVVAEIKKIL